MHTVAENFEHFLSYANLRDQASYTLDDLRKAYEHGASSTAPAQRAVLDHGAR